MKKQKRKKKLKLFNCLIFLVVIFFIMYFSITALMKQFHKGEIYYLASQGQDVLLYNEQIEQKQTAPRGTKVTFYSNKKIEKDKNTYYLIEWDHQEAYVKQESLVRNQKDVVLEKVIYVRTPVNLLSKTLDGDLLDLANKGEELKVVGYDTLDEKGNVRAYQVKLNDTTGYIFAKYTTLTKDEALKHYEEEKYYNVHNERENRFGGGSAGNLDYYPVEKKVFEHNKMPDEVRALYLNGGSETISSVDLYIELAKQSNINAFVVNIKDSEEPCYVSKVMEKYSKTNYEHAFNSFETYQQAIKKIKDAGFYVIGRITVFKDAYYAEDHKEHAITDTRTGQPFLHNNSYWPSAYQREVWKFNVELAKEAVREMGFHEIQFDYVRFPDRTIQLETQGIMDFKNTYQEEKAQAIQRFLRYATDELHQLEVYVSADVFGESAHSYVTAYGQYWPAISNVVDVISGMPYPDHFSAYEYGFSSPVWTMPYEILNYWGSNYVMKRQEEIPTPAIVRTWVQAYDTIRAPYITYGAKEVSKQIQGLYDAGLKGGYMTWNSASSLSKYKSQLEAYKKEYLNG